MVWLGRVWRGWPGLVQLKILSENEAADLSERFYQLDKEAREDVLSTLEDRMLSYFR